MTLLAEFRRVRKDCPCPVCSRPDWCMISRDNPPSKAICKRIASPRPWGEAGYFHHLRDDGWRSSRLPVRTLRIEAPAKMPDLTDTAERYQRAVRAEDLDRLSVCRASAASLRRMGVGRAAHPWAFPMFRADGRVCGVRLRLEDGQKWSVRGGREGIFVPTDLDASGVLAIAEGPTDCAALLDLGLECVGRPNCTGGGGLLARLVKTARPATVVVFADSDGPGQAGANDLVAVLASYCRDARVVTPPAKDARAWFNAGATPTDARSLIDSVSPIRLSVRLRSEAP